LKSKLFDMASFLLEYGVAASAGGPAQGEDMIEPRKLRQLVRDAAPRHRVRRRSAHVRRLGIGEVSAINRLGRYRAVASRYDP
jgi:hypothetical protein